MTKAKTKDPTAPEGAEISSWRGYLRYQCTACAFDTLDADKFADHWTMRHGSLESHADPVPDFAEATSPPVGETFVQE